MLVPLAVLDVCRFALAAPRAVSSFFCPEPPRSEAVERRNICVDTTAPNGYSGLDRVKLETRIVSPEVIVTSVRFRSQPEVPTEPSITTDVPLDLSARNQVAVPEATAVMSAMAAAVATADRVGAVPEAAEAPKAVAAKLHVPSRVWAPIAVLASVGCVPV